MPASEQGRCESCGAASVLVPFLRDEVRWCGRCGAWAYAGEIASAPGALYGERYFLGNRRIAGI